MKQDETPKAAPFVLRNVTFRGEGQQDPAMTFAGMLERSARGVPGEWTREQDSPLKS